MSDAVSIFKVWRSEIPRLAVFAMLCVLAVVLSRELSGSVISGELLTLGDTRIDLHLPLFWLLPLGSLLELLYRIYNNRYSIDPTYVEARTGILSLNQQVVRIRYEDIRGVESDQGILGRLLDFGDVQVGTAASSEMEVVFHGIAAPKEVREMIERERDRRVLLANKKKQEPKQAVGAE